MSTANDDPGDDGLRDGDPQRRLSLPGAGKITRAHTNLVMGFDLAPASQCALEVAADLARRLDAHLHVVHVVDLSDYPIDPDGANWEEQAQAALAMEQETVRAALSAFEGQWTYHAWRGNPAALLVTVADEYDALMLVIGASREGLGPAISHLLNRSVSRGLTGSSGHRPVLVVPRNAARSRRADPAQPVLG